MNNNYINYLIGKKSSANTISTYTKAVNDCLKYIEKEDSEIKLVDLMNYVASISGLASATIGLKISAIKSYFKFLKAYGFIAENPALELEAPSVKHKEKKFVDSETIRKMVDNANNERDKAVILAFATTGMRVSELTSLELSAWNKMRKNGENYITIKGKGNKERNVYFNQQVIEATEEYLKWRRAGGNVLYATREGNAMARNNISIMLKVAAQKAGIPYANEFSCHWLRAAAASIMSEHNVPIAVIRDTLGHSSIAVTNRYIKTSAEQIESANAAMVF